MDASVFVVNAICFWLLTDDSDSYDMPPVRSMFGSGQPLDHEPNMGQVPIVPPGTPPGDSWISAHHFGRLQGPPPPPPPPQQSVNPHRYLPGHQSPPNLAGASQLGMVLHGGPGGGDQLAAAMNSRLPIPPPYQDVSDNESYVPYQAVTSQQGHVEVY